MWERKKNNIRNGHRPRPCFTGQQNQKIFNIKIKQKSKKPRQRQRDRIAQKVHFLNQSGDKINKNDW